jgi:glutamine amidotransferase
LKKFADIARNSKEYQGHGWGCAYQDDGPDGTWKIYKNISPIWEDDLEQFGRT